MTANETLLIPGEEIMPDGAGDYTDTEGWQQATGGEDGDCNWQVTAGGVEGDGDTDDDEDSKNGDKDKKFNLSLDDQQTFAGLAQLALK